MGRERGCIVEQQSQLTGRERRGDDVAGVARSPILRHRLAATAVRAGQCEPIWREEGVSCPRGARSRRAAQPIPARHIHDEQRRAVQHEDFDVARRIAVLVDQGRFEEAAPAHEGVRGLAKLTPVVYA